MGTVVTTAYRPTAKTIAEAERIAAELSISSVSRNKRSIETLHTDERSDVIVAMKERLELYPLGKAEPFFFHPNSAAFRTKRPLEKDPLIEISGLQPGDRFLDCTLGMASDAITVSQWLGEAGRVVGCESNPNIAFIIREGLQSYGTMPHLTAAMRRIEVVARDAVEFLKEQADDSFDVIYMDPMFTEMIAEASNFAPVRNTADMGQLTEEWVREAERVAAEAIILKAHFRSTDFETFGFQRRVRPNTKFHYGIIHTAKNKTASTE